MSETQSRYGMVQEMKNRKIKEKEKLSNIEKEIDERTYKDELHVEKIKDEIQARDRVYEFEHKQKVREMEVAFKLLDSEYKNKLRKLSEEIGEEKATYKKRHADWVAQKNNEIKTIVENLDRTQKIYEKKIKDKEAVIEEIENGIQSLKEISKSQGD